MQNKKFIYIIAVIVIVIVIVIVAILSFFGIIPSSIIQKLEFKKGPQVVEEELVIPDTQKITGGEGRFAESGNINVSLVPKSEAEKVIVAKAVLTVKASYDLAKIEAGKWSTDAKLTFIKSLGAVTLEGKSSQWQVVFISKSKAKKGYEVIVQSDQIVSKKEIDSSATGADLPKNWIDSWEAIKLLQDLPQFSEATISSISLYYNIDGKIWRYALSTSRGTTSVSAE